MYLPYQQFHFWDDGPAERYMTVVLQTTGSSAALASAVRQEIRAVDPGLPLGEFRTMEQIVRTSTARSRLLTWLVAVFSTLALLLATVGIYGWKSMASWSGPTTSTEIGRCGSLLAASLLPGSSNRCSSKSRLASRSSWAV